ncbi:hypothetical protein KVV02_004386 [Mortierella alpina]|uniref:Uncharacterized protein n=1 Tax=Mortierella alpina TaxID=64518 RepID=A0A9P8A0K5_MORAP|nr:hypothetical protein KVV02_004386 [Mortierella alpina]
MSTSRTPARSHGTMAQAQSLRGSLDHAPPRRAKVAVNAQIDLSSIAFAAPSIRVGGTYGQHHPPPPSQHQQQQQPHQSPPSHDASRPSVKVRSAGPGATVSTLRPGTSGNNSPSLRDAHRSVRFSNAPGLLSNSNSSSSSGILRRIGAAGIGLGVGLNSGAAGAGGKGGLAVAGSNTLPGVRDGSVTSSDDGTLSEDSIEDHIQLFSGAGGHLSLNGMPFTASTRQHGSVSGSSGGLPKKAASPASVANGSTRPGTSAASAVSTTGQTIRPRRMAAGASINADMPAAIPIPTLSLSASSSTPAAGVMGSGAESAAGSAAALLSTSASSSTSSSSLSWVSTPSSASSSQRNSVNGASLQTSAAPSPRLGADDAGAGAFRAPSPTRAGSHLGRQLQSQPSGTATQSRPVATLSSGSHISSQPIARSRSVAAANKLAGESRRTEDAARTRRKIGDLEISNTSLLQINQTLEATVRKQAAEIQELKQRIQTSSQFGNGFILIPDNTPSRGKDVSSEIIPDNTTPRPKSVITNETAVIILELTEAERQADLTFKRLCATIEQMMFEARQALDQSMRPAGVKVLSSFDMHEKDKVDEDDLDLADQPIILDDDADKSLDLSIPAMEDDDQDLNDASTLGADSTLG